MRSFTQLSVPSLVRSALKLSPHMLTWKVKIHLSAVLWCHQVWLMVLIHIFDSALICVFQNTWRFTRASNHTGVTFVVNRSYERQTWKNTNAFTATSDPSPARCVIRWAVSHMSVTHLFVCVWPVCLFSGIQTQVPPEGSREETQRRETIRLSVLHQGIRKGKWANATAKATVNVTSK